jgi:ribosomal protein S18 acetylase RimI-like enzyme
MNSISKATKADVANLVKLVNSAYRGDSSKKGWTTEADLLDGIRTDEESMTALLQQEGSTLIKYEDEDQGIVGCVNLQTQGNKLYLGMLTVSPDLQGAGVGKRLLSAAEDFARENKFSSIVMSVISVREELISWYERKGYVKTGEKKPFPMDDPKFGLPKQHLEFIIMEKPI